MNRMPPQREREGQRAGRDEPRRHCEFLRPPSRGVFGSRYEAGLFMAGQEGVCRRRFLRRLSYIIRHWPLEINGARRRVRCCRQADLPANRPMLIARSVLLF